MEKYHGVQVRNQLDAEDKVITSAGNSNKKDVSKEDHNSP